ncbi:MAG: S41 family peptidase [Bacteroidetes bacterium]|nr:S41 family peptidase [Bacteroidota bacterium]
MKKRTVSLGIILTALITLGFTAYDNVYQKIGQNIDIFGRVYKEIVANYVDEVDPEKFMRSGIDGMLGTLDPYTVYLSGREEEDVDMLKYGQYGGVGVSIGVRDSVITVLSTTEGYSAQKQGVKTGDRIIAVDGKSVSGSDPDSARFRVRGEPGTTVRITVEREGTKEPIEFTLVREQIRVSNVSYSGFIRDGVGYIKLDRFSSRAGEEVRQAVKEFKAKGNVKGIVLDLRDNPGGLLEAAVEIVSKFAPAGSTIVTTRGRKSGGEQKFTVLEEPVAADIPLAVLVNKNSASASEIVAGAVQDLDRGVIVGERSFGKGLVQTVVPLNHAASMKMTTARYYTPSGRSIQEIDYLHRNKEGVFTITPDSLKREFRTARGRIVKELGGISPDSVIVQEQRSEYVTELLRKAMFFKFATRYTAERPAAEGDLTVTPAVMKAFEQFLAEKKFEYVEPSEQKLNDLKGQMERENYSKQSLQALDALIARVHSEKLNAFTRSADEIRAELTEELNSRYGGEKARSRLALAGDHQAQSAAALVLNRKVYDRMLSAKQ